MRQNPRLFRLSATVAIGALLCGAVLPAATAQPAPPASPATQPDQTQADPPARVGRIASQSGAVSFRTSADTQWSVASPNYPVSAGDAFWTEPTARAELEISASRIDLSGQTEFDVTTLDTGGLQAVAPQGELYVHLVDLAANEVWSVQTPRGMVRMTGSGRYDIVAGTTEQPTTVTVLDGAAEIDGPGVSLAIAAHQTATVTGSGPFQGSVGPAVRDAFLAARLAAERPPSPPPEAIRAQLTAMPGAEDLASYGEWSEAPDYGDVWYPSVAVGWVPYQEGEWAYVAPWGWTWVDSAPWGFAPFHYGRWAHIGNRWGWVPGGERTGERSVYAPALVTFIGFSAGAAMGAAIAGHAIGWVPLGPGEAYHPWYHASQGYVRQINTGHVKDVAAIGNPVTIANLANRAAATSVPASVMLGSRPVRTAARPIPAREFASAQPVVGQQPIRPTVATLGVTPAVARQLNLPAAGGGLAPRRLAPGPVVRVQQPSPASGPPPAPALIGPRGEQAGGPRPGEPAVRGPGVIPAPGGPPPLAAPGARPAGLPEPGGARRPGDAAVPGAQPEGMARPSTGPEIIRPGGPPPLPEPGTRPAGVPEPREVRPGEPAAGTPPSEGRPEGTMRPEPAPAPTNRLPMIERPAPRPAERAPGGGETPSPRIEAPEPPRVAPPPRFEAPAPPRVAPPPRFEAPQPSRPPPPRVVAPEPQRPPPPPPRAESPPPRPQAAPERKPGER